MTGDNSKPVIPQFEPKLRHNILKMPEEIRTASGISIFGRRIKSLVFTTDIAIIRNCDADAVFAVYPFTPQQAISDAKAVNKDKYTDESVAALEKALADAEAMLAASQKTQEQVDAAAKTLRDAINGLKVIETVSPGTGDNGVALFGLLAVLSILGMAVAVFNKRRVAA